MVAASKTRRNWISGMLVVTCAALAGCQTVHEVVVDAISDQSKPMGSAYRLEVHDPSGGVDKALGAEAVTSIKEALGARGLYEAPANTKPDVIIEYAYGVGPAQIKIVRMAPPMTTMSGFGVQEEDYGDKPIIVFEKYITLSAREPLSEEAARGPGHAAKKGEEIWNVRLSVEDQKQDLGPYLPVLASVSVDYMGENSVKEKHVIVKADDAAASIHRREAPAKADH